MENQYGSELEITDDSGQNILGRLRTALPDSGLFGREIEVVGIQHGACIGLTAGGASLPAILLLPIPACFAKAD